MNNSRRKSLAQIVNSLEVLKYQVEKLHEKEQEAYDNLPESLQTSDKGQNLEASAYNLEQAIDTFDYVIDSINEAAE